MYQKFKKSKQTNTKLMRSIFDEKLMDIKFYLFFSLN